MKKTILLLLFSLSCLAAEAQVRFREVSTDALRREAAAADKLVFIDLYATWCGPCKRMDREVFSRPDIAALMERCVVAARYDIDKPTGRALARNYGVRAVPTCLILDTEGQLRGTISGALSPEAFEAALLRIVGQPGEER